MTLSILFPPSLGMAKAKARAELVEQGLTEALEQPVKIEVARTYAELDARASSAEAHMVWAPAGICARIEISARAIFKVVRGGSASYRAAIVARRSSHIQLDEMRGLVAAWVDPLSVGGYLLAVGYLRERGIDPDRVFREQRFLGSHPDVVHALLQGDADIAAVTVPRAHEGAVMAAVASYVGPHADKITCLAITDDAPTDAIVLTPRLTPAEARRITRVLAPPGYDVRPPSRLLAAMEADTLVLARSGEYQPILRLIRGARRP